MKLIKDETRWRRYPHGGQSFRLLPLDDTNCKQKRRNLLRGVALWSARRSEWPRTNSNPTRSVIRREAPSWQHASARSVWGAPSSRLIPTKGLPERLSHEHRGSSRQGDDAFRTRRLPATEHGVPQQRISANCTRPVETRACCSRNGESSMPRLRRKSKPKRATGDNCRAGILRFCKVAVTVCPHVDVNTLR